MEELDKAIYIGLPQIKDEKTDAESDMAEQPSEEEETGAEEVEADTEEAEAAKDLPRVFTFHLALSDSSTYHRWRRLGMTQQLDTDEAIATFLMDWHEERVGGSLPGMCSRCCCPLPVLCVSCQLYRTSAPSSQLSLSASGLLPCSSHVSVAGGVARPNGALVSFGQLCQKSSQQLSDLHVHLQPIIPTTSKSFLTQTAARGRMKKMGVNDLKALALRLSTRTIKKENDVFFSNRGGGGGVESGEAIPDGVENVTAGMDNHGEMSREEDYGGGQVYNNSRVFEAGTHKFWRGAQLDYDGGGDGGSGESHDFNNGQVLKGETDNKIWRWGTKLDSDGGVGGDGDSQVNNSPVLKGENHEFWRRDELDCDGVDGDSQVNNSPVLKGENHKLWRRAEFDCDGSVGGDGDSQVNNSPVLKGENHEFWRRDELDCDGGDGDSQVNNSPVLKGENHELWRRADLDCDGGVGGDGDSHVYNSPVLKGENHEFWRRAELDCDGGDGDSQVNNSPTLKGENHKLWRRAELDCDGGDGDSHVNNSPVLKGENHKLWRRAELDCDGGIDGRGVEESHAYNNSKALDEDTHEFEKGGAVLDCAACQACGMRFKSQAQLFLHRSDCPWKIVKREDNIPHHNTPHTTADPPQTTTIHNACTSTTDSLTCQACGQTFRRAQYLKRHILCVHTETDPVVCPEENCGRRFKRQDLLDKHQKCVHAEARLYVCQACKARFSTRKSLVQHLLSCGGKTPYSCSLCLKAFCNRSGLRAHKQRSHEGQTSVCVCGKMFHYHTSLVRHAKTCRRLHMG